MKAAVIAAAGWKPAGSDDLTPPDCPDFLRPLEGCPNSLLPIGQGQTILSRLSKQLEDLGFEVYAAVGKPGCLFENWTDRVASSPWFLDSIPEAAFELGRGSSPWTDDRVDYVRSFAECVLMPDPGKHNCWDGYFQTLNAISGRWDKVIMMHGDILIKTEVLKRVISLPTPHVYVLTRLHDILWFDKDSIELFLKSIGQVIDIPRTPGNQVIHTLRKMGVPVVEHGPFPSEDWCDVDYPRSLPPTGTGPHVMSYERALAWVRHERDI